jgi:colanic acid/amylovoran biosynthesis glycosyltransferase
LRTIVVYRSALLPSMQTFIPFQAEAIREYLVRYVGLEAVSKGVSLPRDPVFLATDRSLGSRVLKNIFKLTGFAPAFHQKVASLRPCLIHAHFVMDGIHALPLATSLNVPLIVTLHGHLPTSGGKTVALNSVDGLAFNIRKHDLWRRCSLFICVSEFIRQKALELGYPEEKLQLHYIGTDLAQFSPGNGKRDPNLILFVGRFVEKKGCKYLLRAMVKVQKQIPTARLVIVGEGPERAALEQEAAALKINAHFTGEASIPTVLSWLHKARVFCAPSVTAANGDIEGLGMVFAEAQATGLPVVSFRHGGIPEVVLHGKTGLLAPERDHETLADYLVRYLTDDSFWNECSANTIPWIRQRFDLQKQTQELEQIYSSLVPEASMPPANSWRREIHPSSDLPMPLQARSNEESSKG